MSKNIESSVFFEDDPSCLSKLKSCAFFWEKICVYPSFIQDLSNMSQESQEYRDLETLINAKVIKFAVENEAEFESNLFDSTYCHMDKNLRDYLYKHSNDFIVKTTVPENSYDIIKNASSCEYNNDALKKTLDDSLYNSIKNSVLEDMSPSLKYSYYDPRKEIQKIALEAVETAISIQYSQYQKREEHIRYGFEWLNESLILKSSVSSSILTNEYLYSYYNYKLNNFKISDANLYLKGLDAAIPLVSKKNIDDFSLEDILEIRKMKEWKKAMGRLGEICSTSKYHHDTKEFQEEINQEIVGEILDAFDDTRQSKQDLVTSGTKNAAWTAVSFIPVVGAPISALGSMGDTVASYFINERKQKALPVFMTNIRKMK
ncbi:hypothetical protein FXV91_17340 [Methanosarcina sp. DH2]|nr:hypothetical protein [Methanosarcina sp. DH2]